MKFDSCERFRRTSEVHDGSQVRYRSLSLQLNQRSVILALKGL